MSEQPPPGRRDHLALVRTDLANERTLLAYSRTALMIIATGFSLIKFFTESPLLIQLGWAMCIAGTIVSIIGVVRFTRLSRRLRHDD